MSIFSATILVSILASDLSLSKIFENICQLLFIDNVIKLWDTFYHKAWLVQHTCYDLLTQIWSEYLLPVLHHFRIKALEAKLQLLQAKIRAAEKRYEQDQQRCDSRSDEMKGITQLLQILQDTMRELSMQQEADCSACENRFAALEKRFEEKVLAMQITLTGLCTAGEHFRAKQERMAEEYETLKVEQKRLAAMMEHSVPSSNSIEQVQLDVEALRSYLLEEADSRRSLIKGRRASVSPLSQSQSSL